MALIKGKQILSIDASKIVESESKKFVSQAEKDAYAGKAENTVATTGANGLLSKEDKAKLDGVAENANNYVHPANHDASVITETAEKQFVSAAEKTAFADKYTKTEIDNKLAEIESGIEWLASVPTFADLATTYPAPTVNSVAMVDDVAGESVAYRFNGTDWVVFPIVGYNKATQSADGLMSKEDKTKLDGVQEGANNYVHPVSHDPSIISETAEKQFISAAEKTAFAAKASTDVATTGANGLMSSTDKTKLDSLEETKLASITINPASAGATAIPTGIKTNGTGLYNTNSVDLTLAINGFVQARGAGKDYTVSESAENELVINWFNRHFSLDTDDELVIAYMQIV